MADTISTQRSKSLAELEAEYDKNAPMVSPGLDFLRREIEWRHQSAQTDKIELLTTNMEQMTKTIKWLTLIAAISSIVSVVVSLAGLFQ
jgi:hypothetical protein